MAKLKGTIQTVENIKLDIVRAGGYWWYTSELSLLEVNEKKRTCFI